MAALSSTLPCGLIEYKEAGTGAPLLSVHGSGGGFDLGIALTAPLTTRPIRVIAISRFGYLRPPMDQPRLRLMPFVCLMDALGEPTAAVMGGSAGALPALQLAVRHPDRVSALILLVPSGDKPPGQPYSAAPIASLLDTAMMWVIRFDFLFWSAMHTARNRIIETVLATPPGLLATASPAEQARINAMLDGILPVSARAVGLRADTAAGKTMVPVDLSRMLAHTLIISVRDDG